MKCKFGGIPNNKAMARFVASMCRAGLNAAEDQSQHPQGPCRAQGGAGAFSEWLCCSKSREAKGHHCYPVISGGKGKGMVLVAFN